MGCYCKYCGRPTDCSGDTCELCECDMATLNQIEPHPSNLLYNTDTPTVR